MDRLPGQARGPGTALPQRAGWVPTTAVKAGQAQAVVLSPTRVVRHPGVLIAPDVHGLTTAILDGAIRLAQQGFEVLFPDVNLAGTFGPPQLFATRSGVWARNGVPLRSSAVAKLVGLYSDGLEALRGRPMVDPEKSAILGLSYGGALAVGVAARDQKLGALVLAYPVPVSPPEWLPLVTAPVLLIAGRRDRLGQKARGQFLAHFPKDRFESFDPGNVGHDFLARDVGATTCGPPRPAGRGSGSSSGAGYFPGTPEASDAPGRGGPSRGRRHVPRTPAAPGPAPRPPTPPDCPRPRPRAPRPEDVRGVGAAATGIRRSRGRSSGRGARHRPAGAGRVDAPGTSGRPSPARASQRSPA